MSFSRFASGLVLMTLVAVAPVSAQWSMNSLKDKVAGAMSSEQMSQGVKDILTSGAQYATQQMLSGEGFELKLPESLSAVQTMLAKTGQTSATTNFSASLNSIAEKLAPEYSTVISQVISGLSVDNPASLFKGASKDAITQYLRSQAEPTLRKQLLPLITESVKDNKLVAQAKDLIAKAGPTAAALGAPSVSSLAESIYSQVLDTGFGYMAKQEAAVRDNPSLLGKDSTAAKVLGFFSK